MDGPCTPKHPPTVLYPAGAVAHVPMALPWAGVPVLLYLVLALLAAPSAAHAAQDGERSYGIEGYRVELELGADGGYWVEEAIDFVYQGGRYSQGFRTLTTRGLDAIAEVRVSSPDTEVRDVEIRERGSRVEVTWDFEPRGEPATFVLTYRVLGALQEVEGENRIAWDGVGGDWEVPIRNLEVRILWPDFGLEEGEIRFVPEAEGTLRRQGGAGRGESAAAPISGSPGWEVRFLREEVEARTPYGVQVGFPARLPGRAPPEPGVNRWRVVLLAVAGFLAGFAPGSLLALSWRDPGDPPTPVEPGIPEAPLDRLGYLVSGQSWYGLRVFTAMLVDLARRGHVTLERTEAEGSRGATRDGGGLAPGKLVVHRADPPPTDALSAAEERFLDDLAHHESFQDFRAAGTRAQTLAWRGARAELVRSGHLEEHPERLKGALLASFVLPALVGATAWLASSHGVTGFLAGGALGLMPGLWIAAEGGRYQISERGARLRARIRTRHQELRRELEDALETDPAGAARLLANHLPFLLLDPKLKPDTLRALESAVEESGGALELPDWIHRAVAGRAPAGERTEVELHHLLFFLWISQTSQPRMQMSSSGSGMPGGFSGGAGISTGVGGGGGGMR
jgi:uncharacterized protein YndB with AHSA1/START domain